MQTIGLLQDTVRSREKFVKFLVSSVATPPSVRAEWAFKIFDSDEDQLLGERDIRLSVIRHQVLSSIYYKVSDLCQEKAHYFKQ